MKSLGTCRWLSFVALVVVAATTSCAGTASTASETNDSGPPTSSNPPATTGNTTSEGGEPPASKLATIRVHYPVGARTLSLKGEHAPLTPNGTSLTAGADDTWQLDLGEIEAPVSFVPELDGTAARGPAYSVAPGQTLDVYPHFTATAGKIAALPALKSQIMNNSRGLRIYLPPSYEENTVARYPVVYMHDGQVIFDANLGLLDGAAKSFFGSWKAEKILDEGIEDGSLPEMVVVGIDIIINFDLTNLLANLTAIREQELTPTNVEAARKGSGKGRDYLRMIVEELKPMIDKDYRTIPDAEHTMIAGSSLGGLMSLWAGLDHGDVFGNVLAMSSSAWWDNEVLAKRVAAENGGPHRARKVYTDTGDDETGQSSPEADDADKTQVEQTERLWKAYRDVGYVDDKTLKTRLEPGAQHKGQYWSARLNAALAFLFGPGR